MNLSAVIPTKNEEKNIAECVRSVSFCDEVIVIDDYSSDRTVEIADGLEAKVFRRNLQGDFAGQRNFGLEKANSKWVLFIDADERVSTELKKEMLKEIESPENPHVGYTFKRDDYIWDKKLNHGETANISLLRLARKSAGKWARRVHEVWKVGGRTKSFKNPLVHYPHQTLGMFVRDLNFHSDLHAEANLGEGKRSTLVKIIFIPLGKFINNWIFRLGFLDGTEGFVFALMMSFHSFLAWSKLWIIQRTK